MILKVLTDNEVETLEESETSSPLRIISTPTLITEGVRDLVRDMKETMLSLNGIGLAAPQVGVNLRVIVIIVTGQLSASVTTSPPVQEMINPVITSYSSEDVEIEEGCLSIPGEYLMIKRPHRIHVKFQDLSGKYKKWNLKGLEARVVQHEIDHLDGILMTERSERDL